MSNQNEHRCSLMPSCQHLVCPSPFFSKLIILCFFPIVNDPPRVPMFFLVAGGGHNVNLFCMILCRATCWCDGQHRTLNSSSWRLNAFLDNQRSGLSLGPRWMSCCSAKCYFSEDQFAYTSSVLVWPSTPSWTGLSGWWEAVTTAVLTGGNIH